MYNNLYYIKYVNMLLGKKGVIWSTTRNNKDDLCKYHLPTKWQEEQKDRTGVINTIKSIFNSAIHNIVCNFKK
jgi:hypothetical protein